MASRSWRLFVPTSQPETTFRFDAETHQYWLDDEELPPVSSILVDAGLAPKFSYRNSKIDYARDLGTYVHAACALWDRLELDEDVLDPAIVPYLAGWRAFCQKHACRWRLIEDADYHATLGYAGIVDRCGQVGFETFVVEIKTGQPAEWHGIQLSAYLPLTGETDAGLMAVYLHADGTYNEVVYPNRFEVFEAALTVARWKKEAK